MSFILTTRFSVSIGGGSALAFGATLNIGIDSCTSANVAGTNGTGFGAGGTGATTRGTSAGAGGGNGSAGCAIFEWYAYPSPQKPLWGQCAPWEWGGCVGRGEPKTIGPVKG